MIFTLEELEQIKLLAGLFLNYDEIALLMNKDVDDFKRAILKRKSPGWTAYNTGKAESKKTIREREIEMAKHGSPQAVILTDNYMREQSLYED